MTDSGFRHGFVKGLLVIYGLYAVLKALDQLILYWLDRPLFTKPDSLQLIVLTILIMLFRQPFKAGDFHRGSGIFLATFLSAIGYLIYRKYNFAP